ncbi:hypothetical protein ACGFNX_30335 [Streptomyces sp. NPDC048723]|uniref:hypothetical protein n=1 Tax=unclassified Streptomyces TaxID=2593676 RepID=UPI0035685940
MQRYLDVPVDGLGHVEADAVEDGGDDVDGVVVLSADLSPGSDAGQETMHGSQVPPLKEYRFHILNGVLKASAQPLG